jgi:hypothetical protein
MSESKFIESIECRFPYLDRTLALEVAEEGCSISSNAAFAVADEISRPPAGEPVDQLIASDVLSHIEARVSHPLTSAVITFARRLVTGKTVSVPEAVALLREIEKFPGQYAALSIAYFASDDIAGIADAEYNRIMAAWSAP